MSEPVQLHHVADGDIALWIDDGQTIHLKVRAPFGDPIELSEDEALALAHTLTLLAQRLRTP